jgi:hypothetical protein
MTEAFPWDTAPRYLLRDRDKSYGPAFRHRVRAMGITEVITGRGLPGRTRTLSVSSVRSAKNVWITSSSSTSAICTAFYRAIFNTIMTPERISRSARTARGPAPYSLPRPATSLPSRKLAVCTIAMSVELLRLHGSARTRLRHFEQGQERKQRNEGGNHRDHARHDTAVAQKSLGVLDTSKF